MKEKIEGIEIDDDNCRKMIEEEELKKKKSKRWMNEETFIKN